VYFEVTRLRRNIITAKRPTAKETKKAIFFKDKG
jgi:hypothetical protein